MVEPQELLDYYARAVEADGCADSVTVSGTRFWRVPFDEVRAGGLSSHVTREVLLSYASQHGDTGYGERDVPVLCALRVLQPQGDAAPIPALLVRATLDASGELHAAEDARAWVPLGLLATDDLHNAPVVVCDLDAYRAHQAALESLPQGDAWPAIADRAMDLFNAVSTLDDATLERAGLRLLASECLLFVWERPDEALEVSRALDTLAQELQQGSAEGVSGPARRLLAVGEDQATRSPKSPEGERSSTAEALPDDALISHKLLCGIPDGLPPLEKADHEALFAFAGQGDGDVLALRTPLGTNAHAVALAMMANLLTESALRGDKAPMTVCVASPEDIDHLLELLSRRPTRAQASLYARWLPRVALARSDEPSTHDQRRVLGSLGTLCLVHSCDGMALGTTGAFLRQPFAHPLGGDGMVYGDPWYVPQASLHYLDCASSFLGTRVQSVAAARTALQELLRRIDQERCELIDAYAEVCRASDMLLKRDNLVERIGRLRRAHAARRKRLGEWERILRDSPRRWPLLGKAEGDQSALIARNALPGEELAQNKHRVEEVLKAYRSDLARIESSIDRLRGASANLARRIRAVAPAGERCSRIIGRLRDLCKLTPKQTSLLETAIDGRNQDVSLELLDRVLDQTVRPAEFWLSVHVYESHWIDQNRRKSMLARRLEGDDRGLGTLWSCLCPFALVPMEAAVGTIGALVGSERMGLVVALGAQRMSDACGLALASHAGRMAVLGSAATPGSAASRNVTFDELWTCARYGRQRFDELAACGLCLSSGTSMLDRALGAGGVPSLSLCDVCRSYAELNDLRATLIPEEPLHTTRVPAFSRDDPAHALEGLMGSLSYVLVPDSAWEQCGPSKQNRAEAMALGRWLSNHRSELDDRYGANRAPLALLAPFSAQALLLRNTLAQLPEPVSRNVAVLTPAEVRNGRWPVVVFCATCGPEAYAQGDASVLARVLSLAIAAATDAFLMFCGGAWTRSANEAAQAVLRKSTCVGRLFSTPRKRLAQEGATPWSGMHAHQKPKVKPLALTALLARLKERGDISSAPDARAMNKALEKAGLIERAKGERGASGWRPTAAGREIGILPTRDARGNPFCAYAPTSAPVVARIAAELAKG